MYKCHLPDPTKDDKPVQAKRAVIDRPESSRARCRDEEDDDDVVMMTSMIQLMSKTSSRVPNLLMLLRVHKLRCVCHYQVVHEAIIRVWIQPFNYALEIKLVMWLFIC